MRLGPKSGSGESSTLENTDVNCLFRTLALCFGSVWTIPASFSGETPSWSQRFDLTRAPSFLLPHGSLFTTSNTCLLYACLHIFFVSFFSQLNRAQSLSLPVCLALLYARFLRLTALLVFVLNQGCPRRVELNLEGTWSDTLHTITVQNVCHACLLYVWGVWGLPDMSWWHTSYVMYVPPARTYTQHWGPM